MIKLVEQATHSGANFLIVFLVASKLGIEFVPQYTAIYMVVTFLSLGANATLLQQLIVVDKYNRNKIYDAIFCSKFFRRLLTTLTILAAFLLFLSVGISGGAIFIVAGGTIFVVGTFLYDQVRRSSLIVMDDNTSVRVYWTISKLAILALIAAIKFEHLSLLFLLVGAASSTATYLFILVYRRKTQSLNLTEFKRFIKVDGTYNLLISIMQWTVGFAVLQLLIQKMDNDILGEYLILKNIFGVMTIFMSMYENYKLPRINSIATSSRNFRNYLNHIPVVALFLFSFASITYMSQSLIANTLKLSSHIGLFEFYIVAGIALIEFSNLALLSGIRGIAGPKNAFPYFLVILLSFPVVYTFIDATIIVSIITPATSYLIVSIIQLSALTCAVIATRIEMERI